MLGTYQTTRHAPEALYRLTEAYLGLGITDEAETAAAVLGHNFPDSEWYKDAYALLKSGGHSPQEHPGTPGCPRSTTLSSPPDEASARNMLARLAIRDIVLIDQLDLEFARGLTILTGETGAGKSILLDALSLALGARGDGALVRQGQPQGQVTAVFELPAGHPSRKALETQEIPFEGELILRRVQMADGRTRAFVNDQSVSAQTLRALAADLVEIHGQHDERALMDSSTHRSLVDAYGGLQALGEGDAGRLRFAALARGRTRRASARASRRRKRRRISRATPTRS